MTIRAAADKIGPSQTTPYRRLKDKRDLRDLLEAGARESLNEVSEILGNATRRANSPFGALRLAILEYFDLARRYPLRNRLLFEFSEEGGLQAEARRAFASVRDLVIAAQQAGELHDRDPTEISALICSTVHGLAELERLGEPRSASVLNDVDALSLLFIDLIDKRAGQVATANALV